LLWKCYLGNYNLSMVAEHTISIPNYYHQHTINILSSVGLKMSVHYQLPNYTKIHYGGTNFNGIYCKCNSLVVGWHYHYPLLSLELVVSILYCNVNTRTNRTPYNLLLLGLSLLPLAMCNLNTYNFRLEGTDNLAFDNVNALHRN